MAKKNQIKQYDPMAVSEFITVFAEIMEAEKKEFPKSTYQTTKDKVLDEISEEMQTPKPEFLVLMSGLEVISNWESWYDNLTSK